MYKEMYQAYLGKRLWNRLQKKYHADKYLIFPHVDDEYNDYALQYLDEYFKKEKAKHAVILASDNDVISKCRKYHGTNQITVLPVSMKKIDDILRFYALYAFSEKLTIISLTRPYNTCGENLLGVHGVTKRELLCYDIYRFKSIPDTNDSVWE